MTPLASSVATRRRRDARVSSPIPAVVRCAIYTRKSTNEGLDGDFTTLMVQRQAAEAYVLSQGWLALPKRYDDGGFSGGTMDRPALQELMADIEAGLVDCVVVHKIDRLSRSLLDFVRIAEVLESRQVGLVSVTQQISTTTSAGRLMLNVLFSFAQFEREIIGERTASAMSAARRKGRWCGGPPILGYDIDPERHCLVVNPDEADMVRDIFALYLERRSTVQVVREINGRGWTTKSWTRKNKTRKEGSVWNKNRLLAVLANVTYAGRVKHDGELLPGLHEGLIDQETFDQVQEIIRGNGNGQTGTCRNKHGALLKGLLKCGHCGAAMAHTFTKKGNRLYRYYQCVTRQKQGKDACPTRSVAAQEIEDQVVGEIRRLARSPEMIEQVFGEAIRQQRAMIPRLEAERKRLIRERQQKQEAVQRLVEAIAGSKKPQPSLSTKLAEMEGIVARVGGRVSQIDGQLAQVREHSLDREHLTQTLHQFDQLWDVMYPAERSELINALIEGVSLNATGKAIQVIFGQSPGDSFLGS